MLKKIKQLLGIGGAKATLTVESKISKDAANFKGKAFITAKSEQFIKEVKVELIEEWTTGRGDNKTTQNLTLGEVVIAKEVTVKPGEDLTFDFECPFTVAKSENDKMAESDNKLLSGLGKAAKFAGGEKSKFTVDLSCDVKGALIGASDSKDVVLV